MSCVGRWLSGSGGHIVWSHDCNEPSVVEDTDTGWEFCAQHIPKLPSGEVHAAFCDSLRPSTAAISAMQAELALLRELEVIERRQPPRIQLRIDELLGKLDALRAGSSMGQSCCDDARLVPEVYYRWGPGHRGSVVRTGRMMPCPVHAFAECLACKSKHGAPPT